MRWWTACVGVVLAGCGGVDAGEEQALRDRLDQMQRRLEAMEKHLDQLEDPKGVPAAEPAAAPPTVPLELPTAETINDGAYRVLVRVDSGTTFVNGNPTTDAKLQAKLSDVFARNPGASLVVQADEGVNYARIVDVLDKAKVAGFEKIAMATLSPPGSTPGR